MTDGSLLKFFKGNPFWAIFIVIFMVLPIIGAVIHILLKAFGKKGLDNSPSEVPGDGHLNDDMPPQNEIKIKS